MRTSLSTYRRWVLHYSDNNNNNNVLKIMEPTSGDDRTRNWNEGLFREFHAILSTLHRRRDIIWRSDLYAAYNPQSSQLHRNIGHTLATPFGSVFFCTFSWQGYFSKRFSNLLGFGQMETDCGELCRAKNVSFWLWTFTANESQIRRGSTRKNHT